MKLYRLSGLNGHIFTRKCNFPTASTISYSNLDFNGTSHIEYYTRIEPNAANYHHQPVVVHMVILGSDITTFRKIISNVNSRRLLSGVFNMKIS
jgi:hypothetical protein